MRPFGAVWFGHIGDKLGRKRALELSVTLMAIPTFLLGLLPTYDTIGVAAPVLLTVLRLAQGLSVGGEYTSSFSFVIELDFGCSVGRQYRFKLRRVSDQHTMMDYVPSATDYTKESIIDLGDLRQYF